MTDEIKNTDIIPLRGVEKSVLIEEMKYKFHYERVFDPSGTPTNYCTLSYKEDDSPLWSTCNGLLSNSFTIAKTGFIIDQIQKSLDGRITDEKHYRSGTSVKCTFKLSGYQIDIEDEDETDKLLFQIMTGVDPDFELLTTNDLSFNIINGFSGNYALKLNYGIVKTITGDDTVIPMNNIFILDSHSTRLIHDTGMSINIEDVVNVQRSIKHDINIFKQIMLDDDGLVTIQNKTNKRFATKFMTIFEQLPVNFRNLYYASYIFSTLLDTEKNISLEVKLRNYVLDLVKKEVKKNDV